MSRKVRMLIMTFSPISTRPSMVAEPICGSSVTLPVFASRTSFGLSALVLVHVKPGAADLAGFDQLGQCVFVDHLAAGGVDDIGFLADQFQPPR